MSFNYTLKEIFDRLDPETDGASVKYSNYLDIYDNMFQNIRLANVNLLEIGIEKGGSLSMWAKYFQNGTIHGLDIVPGCKKNERDRIKVHIGDQMDKQFLTDLGDRHGPFDIIIDDGGHFTSQHRSCFDNLFRYIKYHGLYIIEDLHTCFMPQFTEGNPDTILNFCQNLAALPTAPESQHMLIKEVHFFKNMVVIQKGKPEGDKVTSPGFEQVPYPK